MSILLWVLQVLAALLYGASGCMKVFMFDKVSVQVPSFGALPRETWEGPRHPRTRLHGRADRPRRPPLAAGAHGGGRHGPDNQEARVRMGVRQLRRDHAHHLKRRAGSPHGVHRVRTDGPEADLLKRSTLHRKLALT